MTDEKDRAADAPAAPSDRSADTGAVGRAQASTPRIAAGYDEDAAFPDPGDRSPGAQKTRADAEARRHRTPWTVAKALWTRMWANHLSLISAGVAFYALLSLFPALTAMMAVSGLVLDPVDVVAQIESLSLILPQQVATIIIDQATAVAGSREGGLGLAAILGLLLAVYSASRGMTSLIEGLNVAYGRPENRGIILRYAITLALTFFLILGLVIGLSSTLLLPIVFSLFHFPGVIEFLVSVGRWVLLAAFTILGLGVVYRFGPDRPGVRFRLVTPGAVAACLGWVAASIGFALYVANFASYNESFGSMAGVIVLLMWLWLSAFVVLIGAELNAILNEGAHDRDARRHHDADAAAPRAPRACRTPPAPPARRAGTVPGAPCGKRSALRGAVRPGRQLPGSVLVFETKAWTRAMK